MMKIKAIAVYVMAFSFVACDSAPKESTSSPPKISPKKKQNLKSVAGTTGDTQGTKGTAKPVNQATLLPEIKRIRTDSAELALRNFRHRLDEAETRYKAEPNLFRQAENLVSLHLKRARFLGDARSYSRALEIAEDTVKRLPKLGHAYRLRATARSAVHLFQEALSDLKTAEEKGAPKFEILRKRELIQVSLGHAKQVLPEWEKRARLYPRWNTIARYANGLSAVGEYTRADEFYEKAFDAYRETSPFIAAWFMFSRGLMWAEKAGQSERGKAFYREAVHYLPDYLVANIHLAELEAEDGEVDQAIARLARIQGPHKDPEIFGKLCTLYGLKGEKTRAASFCQKGLVGYNALLTSHRPAFADHGAEFFMGPGKDPTRALSLAQYNLSLRKTERARALFLEALLFAKKTADACDFASKMTLKSILTSRLREAHQAGVEACP